MRADFVDRFDEAKARSFLDPTSWRNGPDRVISSPVGMRIDWLRQNAGDWLAQWQAKALVERPN